jgi:glycopeptide antibiotics resistance protein
VTFGTIAFVLIVVLFVLVEHVVPDRARLVVWSLIVIGGVVPWSGWGGHAHWDRVEWIPFSTAIRPRDIVLNVLFYVPVGWFFVSPGRKDRRAALGQAVAYGFVLSVVTEATQVFSHRRFPGTSDVVTNTTGAVLGAVMAARWRRRA